MTLHIPATHIQNQRVCVVIPDGTRKLPLEAMLTQSLTHLTQHGAASIEVIVALGLHRPMTREELAPVMRVCQQFDAALIQHDAHDDVVLRALRDDIALFPGHETRRGTLPVTLHRAVCDAELILCIGIVEPHQYAGFSGGVKTIAIGCAGANTIAALHGLEYLRDPRTTLGTLHGNPFRDALGRVAACLNAPVYAYHHLPATPQTPAEHVSGEVHEAFERASHMASERLFTTHAQRVPWACLEVRGPKGANFYQASRAATYVGLVERPIVEPGGVILIDAPCPEGMGSGAGERACAMMLARGHETLLAELEGRAKVPDDITLTGGAQRAYVIARLLGRYQLALVGATPKVQGLASHLVPQFATLPEALTHYGLDAHAGITLRDVFHAVPSL